MDRNRYRSVRWEDGKLCILKRRSEESMLDIGQNSRENQSILIVLLPGLFPNSLFPKAISERLFPNSYFRKAISERLFPNSYFRKAISEKLFPRAFP